MSAAVKTPEGGTTTLDFKVDRCIGLRRIMLLTSLNKSIVKRHEFAIYSTSISKVCSDSSFGMVPRVFNKEVKMALALLLVEGGFCFHNIHSSLLSLMKSLILCWSISAKALLNLEEAPTKLLPLSDVRSLMFPLRPTNLHKHKMIECVFSKNTLSVWIALLDKHVNKGP